LQLSFPELVRNHEEEWIDHLARLERYSTQRWSLKSGQPVKLFPSMRRTGLDGQGHAQAIHG
jgi:hypothetical protein